MNRIQRILHDPLGDWRADWRADQATTAHRHTFDWIVEPEGTVWTIQAVCSCGHVGWGCTAVDSEELNAELKRAFQVGQLSAVGYFVAPVDVPEVPS